jgi:hypothetical protein
VINSRVAERTHLKQNMGKMDMPKIKPIIRSVAWGALTLFFLGCYCTDAEPSRHRSHPSVSCSCAFVAVAGAA